MGSKRLEMDVLALHPHLTSVRPVKLFDHQRARLDQKPLDTCRHVFPVVKSRERLGVCPTLAISICLCLRYIPVEEIGRGELVRARVQMSAADQNPQGHPALSRFYKVQCPGVSILACRPPIKYLKKRKSANSAMMRGRSRDFYTITTIA